MIHLQGSCSPYEIIYAVTEEKEGAIAFGDINFDFFIIGGKRVFKSRNIPYEITPKGIIFFDNQNHDLILQKTEGPDISITGLPESSFFHVHGKNAYFFGGSSIFTKVSLEHQIIIGELKTGYGKLYPIHAPYVFFEENAYLFDQTGTLHKIGLKDLTLEGSSELVSSEDKLIEVSIGDDFLYYISSSISETGGKTLSLHQVRQETLIAENAYDLSIEENESVKKILPAKQFVFIVTKLEDGKNQLYAYDLNNFTLKKIGSPERVDDITTAYDYLIVLSQGKGTSSEISFFTIDEQGIKLAHETDLEDAFIKFMRTS